MHSSLLVRDRHFNWLELINLEAQASLKRFPNNPIVLWMRLLSALKPQKQLKTHLLKVAFNYCFYDLLFWRTLWSLSWKEILVTYLLYTCAHLNLSVNLQMIWLCTCPMISGSWGFWPIWEKTRRGQICHWRLISVLVLRGGMLHSVSDSVCYATTEEKYPSQCQVSVSCCTSALILFGLTQNIVQDYFQELEYNMELFWSTQTDTRKRFMFWRECKVKFVHALVLQHTNTHLWIYSACKASKARAITLSFLCWKFLLGNMNCQ